MKAKLIYGSAPSVLPEIEKDILLSAGELELKSLLLIVSNKALATDVKALSEELQVTQKAVKKALDFWQNKGLLSMEEPAANMEKPAEAEKTKKQETSKKQKKDAEPPKRSRTVEIPVYTDEEFTNVLNRRADLAALIDEAQNALGRTLYQEDSKRLVSIAESYEFDEEYMLVLLAYCRRIGKKSLRYVEKVATNLYDLNIKGSHDLNEYIRVQEEAYHLEKTVRKIFGLGERALTSKEKAALMTWSETYQFDKDMIQKAYDITIGATAKPSLLYANSILERWFAEGIKTPADLEEAKKKTPSKSDATSFNADDFFKAALDRSYNDEDKKE